MRNIRHNLCPGVANGGDGHDRGFERGFFEGVGGEGKFHAWSLAGGAGVEQFATKGRTQWVAAPVDSRFEQSNR